MKSSVASMEVLKSFENESTLSEEGKNTLVKAATLARSILPNKPDTSNKEYKCHDIF